VGGVGESGGVDRVRVVGVGVVAVGRRVGGVRGSVGGGGVETDNERGREARWGGQGGGEGGTGVV
jgi:hypothetical protein